MNSRWKELFCQTSWLLHMKIMKIVICSDNVQHSHQVTNVIPPLPNSRKLNSGCRKLDLLSHFRCKQTELFVIKPSLMTLWPFYQTCVVSCLLWKPPCYVMNVAQPSLKRFTCCCCCCHTHSNDSPQQGVLEDPRISRWFPSVKRNLTLPTHT